MINYALILFAFLGGWFLHKKKDDILILIRSWILVAKLSKNKDKRYNEFFEDYFDKEDYSKNVEKGEDNNNV